MARVRSFPSAKPAPDLAEVHQRFAQTYARFGNQAAVLAHVPAALRHLMAMLMEPRQGAPLPKRCQEIAIEADDEVPAALEAL